MLVAKTRVLGGRREERITPENRPQRKLIDRVVESRAAWGGGREITWTEGLPDSLGF